MTSQVLLYDAQPCDAGVSSWSPPVLWIVRKISYCKSPKVIMWNTCGGLSLTLSDIWKIGWLNMGYWHQRADERHGNPPPR